MSDFVDKIRKRNRTGGVSVGDTFTVPHGVGGWFKPVRGESGHGDEDSGCISSGKILTVKGFSKEFGALVEYGGAGFGTELCAGSMFFIEPEKLTEWPGTIEAKSKLDRRRDREVERILS